jgi:hypothetical protein
MAGGGRTSNLGDDWHSRTRPATEFRFGEGLRRSASWCRPSGGFIIQRVRVETFRRICMSFDAWIVAFGVSRLLQELQLVESNASYLVLAGVGALDIWLLVRFFSLHGAEPTPPRATPTRAMS